MSSEVKNNINNLLDNLKFKQNRLAELGVVEGFTIQADKIVIILNKEKCGKEEEELKEAITKELTKYFANIEFIETQKRPVSYSSFKKKYLNIKKVILVSSGKGGVGKSTITYYLAQNLAQQGKKIAVLDADIYGPSIPILAGIGEEPKIKEGLFEPIIKDNIKYNSIGFLIPPDKSLVWRGPMITKAVHKLLNETNWGELDYLLIDMPPGTGDIHLTICEKYHVDKVIMVTTPSKIAEADVKRAEDMYKKLGLTDQIKIANMAYIDNGLKRIYPFGSSEEALQLPLIINQVNKEELKTYLSKLKIF